MSVLNQELREAMIGILGDEVSGLLQRALAKVETDDPFKSFLVAMAEDWIEAHGSEAAGDMLIRLSSAIKGNGSVDFGALPQMTGRQLSHLTELLQAEEAQKVERQKKWAQTLGISLRGGLKLIKSALLVAIRRSP